MDRSTPPDSTPSPRVRCVAIAALLGTLASAAWLLVVLPAIVGFGVAVAAAFTWCFWLDQRSKQRSSAGSDDGGQLKASGVVLALFASVLPASAQTPPEPPASGVPAASQPDANPWQHVKFGATFEGYYQYNWNRPPDRSVVLRAYDTRSNVFSIQQAALVVDAAPDVSAGRGYGLRLDLQFGQATETVQGSGANEPRPDVYRHVWQAYGTYVFPVGANGLQADFGKFGSMLGYETNYAKDNQAFSRAYLFNFLPFYHSGLRLTLPLNDKVSVLYMLTNGVQQTEDFNDFKSNHIAGIVKPVPQVTWTVNYYFGQEQNDGGEPEGPDGFFRVFDTYVSVTPTSALTLGLDVNYVTNEVAKADPGRSLTGVGAYARYQVTPPAALALRYERLDDEGLFGGIDQLVQEITATVEYKFADGFIARGEFRRDWSNENFFPGREPGELRDHQHTLLIGLIWTVGNKSGVW